MLAKFMTATALAGALVIGAGTARALTPGQAARPADLPPPGYAGQSWVDGRGCTYFRAETGAWTLAVSAAGRPVCGSPPAVGAVSPLTGYPVPPGYRVAWQDGRLNPLRGPVAH